MILHEKKAFVLLAATALMLEMATVVDAVVASEKIMAMVMIGALGTVVATWKLAIGLATDVFVSE